MKSKYYPGDSEPFSSITLLFGSGQRLAGGLTSEFLNCPPCCFTPTWKLVDPSSPDCSFPSTGKRMRVRPHSWVLPRLGSLQHATRACRGAFKLSGSLGVSNGISDLRGQYVELCIYYTVCPYSPKEKH